MTASTRQQLHRTRQAHSIFVQVSDDCSCKGGQAFVRHDDLRDGFVFDNATVLVVDVEAKANIRGAQRFERSNATREVVLNSDRLGNLDGFPKNSIPHCQPHAICDSPAASQRYGCYATARNETKRHRGLTASVLSFFRLDVTRVVLGCSPQPKIRALTTPRHCERLYLRSDLRSGLHPQVELIFQSGSYLRRTAWRLHRPGRGHCLISAGCAASIFGISASVAMSSWNPRKSSDNARLVAQQLRAGDRRASLVAEIA